jgi:hypothetical protein
VATEHWLRPDVTASFAAVVEATLRLAIPATAEAISSRSYSPASVTSC